MGREGSSPPQPLAPASAQAAQLLAARVSLEMVLVSRCCQLPFLAVEKLSPHLPRGLGARAFAQTPCSQTQVAERGASPAACPSERVCFAPVGWSRSGCSAGV